jgi:DNA polymerase III delta prime subunit
VARVKQTEDSSQKIDLLGLFAGLPKPVTEGVLQSVSAKRFAHLTMITGVNPEHNFNFAIWLSSLLLCLSEQNADKKPCGVCSACTKLTKLSHESFLKISPDKGSIKVEQAHEVLDFLRLRPWSGNQIVLIEDAHLMTVQSANALLKVFEEPPPSTYFIILSSQPRLVLTTIRSRSQKIYLRSKRSNESSVEDNFSEKAAQVLEQVEQGRVLQALDLMEEHSIDKSQMINMMSEWQKILAQQMQQSIRADKQSRAKAIGEAAKVVTGSFKNYRGPEDWSLKTHSMMIKLKNIFLR